MAHRRDRARAEVLLAGDRLDDAVPRYLHLVVTLSTMGYHFRKVIAAMDERIEAMLRTTQPRGGSGRGG